MSRFTKELISVFSLSALVATAVPAAELDLTFGGPLFGLSTARSGALLVADSGIGVTELRGGEIEKTILLPGVRDVSRIGEDSYWAVVSGDPPGSDNGQGVHLIVHGRSTKVANLFEFEQANNPDGTAVIESNPFDVQSLGAFGALVADAAANALLLVDFRGNVSVLAVFPPEVVSSANIKSLAQCPSASGFCRLADMVSAQAVPTSIAIGRDGYIYVGELKGIPAPVGESNIWRVSPRANWAKCGASPDCEKVFDGGFTSIIDLAFGPDGKLYVAELDERSWIARTFNQAVGGTINACDLKKRTCEEVAGGIPSLTAITFGKYAGLWATRNALTVGGAEVAKVGQLAKKCTRWSCEWVFSPR